MASNYHAAIGSALYSRLADQGTVNTYHTLAPQQGTPPYCTFNPQNPGIDGYVMSGSAMVSTDYVVKVVSNRNWPTEAIDIYTHIHNAVQDLGTAVPGYSLMYCRRTSGVQYRDPDGYWHVGGLYRIDIQEA